MAAPKQNTSRNNKKTAMLVVVTLVTLVLGAIAVITAMRLRQLATEPVAPTAPQSQPQAQEAPGTEGVCIDSFSVDSSQCLGWCDEDSDCGNGFECVIDDPDADEISGVCYSVACPYTDQDENCECPGAGVYCEEKTAYLDDENYTPGVYDWASMTQLADGDAVNPGDIIAYAVILNSTDLTGTASVTDNLPVEVTAVDVSSGCTIVDDQTITCSVTDATLPVTLGYRVQVDPSLPAETSFVNEVYVDDVLSSCTATLETPPEGATPTPTPPDDATPTPTTPVSSPTPTTPTAPTSTPTPPPVCGDSCTSDTECGTNMVCYSGVCRNATCVEEADCVCDGVPGPTATPVPISQQPPSLPTAGIAIPTFTLIAVGALMILAGVAGWLAW